MVGCITENVNENPKGFRSKVLIQQFGSISKTNSGTIKASGYTDLFMAACFCSVVRKQKAIDIMPLISFTNKQIQDKFMDEVRTVANMSSPKAMMNRKPGFTGVVYSEDEFRSYEIYPDNKGDDTSIFMPFFSG